MSKEKKIEEMASIAYPGLDHQTVFSSIAYAQPLVNLYNAGYRVTIKTGFKRVKYDKKMDWGSLTNVDDLLEANPLQGVTHAIHEAVHEADQAHDNFIKTCIVEVGVDPNALTETARLNAALQAELKLLRAERERRADPWISVSERLPEGQGRFLLIDDEGYMFTASWCGDSGWFMPICHGNAITHWMPLPEPPKGDYDGKK